MTDPAPSGVYLEHLPAWVARRLDELYGSVESGSVTLHKNDGEPVKFEARMVRSAREDRPE